MKMTFRSFWALAALLAGGGVLADDAAMVERARSIHDRAITIDTHVDIPLNFGTEAYDPMRPGPRGQQMHIPTLREGGLNAVFLIVFTPQGDLTASGYTRALSEAFTRFSAIHRVTSEMYPDDWELALTADDVRRIHADGRKIVLIGVENGYPVGNDLNLMDVFYDYGARYFGHTHIGHNQLGDSSMGLDRTLAAPEPLHGGLSGLGRAAVKRANKLGIMNDVSHAGIATTLEIAELSGAPVIASHSGVRALYDHPRNLTDEELKAIRDSGGVVQVVAFDTYLRAPPEQKTAALRALREAFGIRDFPDFARLSREQLAEYRLKADEIELRWPKATVSDLVDHIDYAVELIGVDHVGISSDFNGGGGILGWDDASQTFNVTLELVRRGYSDEDIEKIWGGNLLRVMEAVEAYAEASGYNAARQADRSALMLQGE
ncbi:MAG: dipeptidase [Chromatiales bacterium]|nr:dipeptidase [Chromatiales bacterium]